MWVKYKCKECSKDNENMSKICEFCFWVVERVYEAPVKRENPMNREKAIQFLKSQQYVSQKIWKDKRVFQKFKDLIDFIERAVPAENQNKLF